MNKPRKEWVNENLIIHSLGGYSTLRSLTWGTVAEETASYEASTQTDIKLFVKSLEKLLTEKHTSNICINTPPPLYRMKLELHQIWY